MRYFYKGELISLWNLYKATFERMRGAVREVPTKSEFELLYYVIVLLFLLSSIDDPISFLAE